MYVYTNIYIYIYIFLSIYLSICLSISLSLSIYIYTHIYICIYIIYIYIYRERERERENLCICVPDEVLCIQALLFQYFLQLFILPHYLINRFKTQNKIICISNSKPKSSHFQFRWISIEQLKF